MEKTPAIVLLGPTGSGKTPLGELLERRGLWGRPCRHFDFGRHLRRIVTADESPDYLTQADLDFLRTVLHTAALLEDEHFHVADRILRAFIADGANADDLIILNGLPRHVGQASDLDAIVAVQLVIHLDCSPDAARARIRTNVGGDRATRTDDDRRSVRNKLAIFERRVAPLLDYYRHRGLTIEALPVAPDTSPEDVWDTLDERGRDRRRLPG